jgi:hypothetical protein
VTFVCLSVELKEQNQVGGNDSNTKVIAPSVETRTIVCIEEVPRKGAKMNKIDNHKLNDLHHSEILLPPDFDFHGGHHVVVVHGHVNEGIEKSTNELNRKSTLKTDITKEHCDPVMINMKKFQLSFAKNNDHCINQLVVFREIEKVDPKVQSPPVDVFCVGITQQSFCIVVDRIGILKTNKENQPVKKKKRHDVFVEDLTKYQKNCVQGQF